MYSNFLDIQKSKNLKQMKQIFRSAVLASLVIAMSCSKDDNTANEEQMDEVAEQLENKPLEANEVSNDLVIQGGTKTDGVPPTPNEAISLDLSAAGKTAFLNEGFDIPLSSDGTIVGAYLQIKANDGTVADSYFDVNIASNVSGKRVVRDLKNLKDRSEVSAKVDEVNLDVDFGAGIEPGTFCYVICVYDADGNISAPEEVCVTVESWGGNSATVGNWEYTKEEVTQQGETSIQEVGEPDCYDNTVYCMDQSQFEVSVCYVQEYGKLELKSDGTFNLDFKGQDDNFDYEASATQCEAVFGEAFAYRLQAGGNWAYVDDESRLTLVAYSFTTEELGESDSENLASGDGDLIFDGKVEVNGDSFVIIEEDDYDGDGVIDEVYKYYFEK